VPLIPPSTLERLAAAPGGEPASAVCDIDPVSFARAWGGDAGAVRVFAGPGGVSIAGAGEVWRVTARGPARFDDLRRRLRQMPLPAGARAFLGFSFADEGPASARWEGFAAAEAVLPAVIAYRDGRGGRLTVVATEGRAALIERLATLEAPAPPSVPGAGELVVISVPAPTAWRVEVAEAVDAIRSGSIDKVVLARSVVVRPSQRPDPRDLLAQLVAAYPGCYGFSWDGPAGTFLGASPELLVAVHDGKVRSNPLAGTARRGEGDREDRELGRSLLDSAKDRHEHAVVVEDLAARLGPYVDDLRAPSVPSLRRIAGVQHLSTEIHGDLRDDTHLLELVAALHPTPAVGGSPREEAVRFIEKMEGIDRGWYTGGVGWFDAAGAGEVAIALRCGLVGAGEAVVFAGAGIVAGSNPDEELAETRLKLRPLLGLLAAT